MQQLIPRKKWVELYKILCSNGDIGFKEFSIEAVDDGRFYRLNFFNPVTYTFFSLKYSTLC